MDTKNQVYLSDKQLAERYGVARATVWRWIRTSDFPKPRKITPGCSRWPISDVVTWESQK